MAEVDALDAPIGADQVRPLRARFTRESFLGRIGADIRDVLGPSRVQRVVLYGSRARGDAREEGGWDDSDWDIAVFVTGSSPTVEERDRLLDWMVAINDESGWDVRPTLFPQNGWEARTIFMHNLRFEMIDL